MITYVRENESLFIVTQNNVIKSKYIMAEIKYKKIVNVDHEEVKIKQRKHITNGFSKLIQKEYKNGYE